MCEDISRNDATNYYCLGHKRESRDMRLNDTSSETTHKVERDRNKEREGFGVYLNCEERRRRKYQRGWDFSSLIMKLIYKKERSEKEAARVT